MPEREALDFNTASGQGTFVEAGAPAASETACSASAGRRRSPTAFTMRKSGGGFYLIEGETYRAIEVASGSERALWPSSRRPSTGDLKTFEV